MIHKHLLLLALTVSIPTYGIANDELIDLAASRFTMQEKADHQDDQKNGVTQRENDENNTHDTATGDDDY